MEFACEDCGKKFGSKQALEQHKQAKHLKKERKFKIKKFLLYPFYFLILILVFYPIYWAFTSPIKIGPLEGKQVFADFAIFINNHEYKLNQSRFLDRNPYIFISAPYYSLLQVRAENVPLKFFFQSINWKISRDCLELHNNEKYCTNETHSLKFYVNRKKMDDISYYVVQDLDKILISFGNETEEEIQKQLNSISDFAWKASAGLI